MDILKRIDVCLAERGISKEKFYSESGVSSASYSQWNKGVHEPTAKKLKQIADYLNISMQYLLTGEEQKESPPQGGELSKETLLDVVKSTDDDAFLLEIMAAVTARMKERSERKIKK